MEFVTGRHNPHIGGAPDASAAAVSGPERAQRRSLQRQSCGLSCSRRQCGMKLTMSIL